MQNSTKILLGVGGVALLGVGIWLIFRKPGSTTTTTTEEVGGGGLDPSAQPTDTLGTTLGNLITNIWGKVEQNKKKANCSAPVDGYSYDGVEKDDYDEAEIKSMQTWLSNLNPDIKVIIDKTGGIDGKIGGGFKTSYNMARTACSITGIDDLETKSGIA